MLLLMLFAVIAGAGTAITPCVLPVLPALLSASALGGRRRPLGIVIGLAVTFTVAIVAVAQLVKGVGLAAGATRTLAVIVLIAFGVVLMVPGLAARVQAPLSRLARFGPKTRGDGFLTGLAVGGALGFVCAPCAGPILAAVTSVSASAGANAKVVLVAISYALGLSAVLLLWALGGRAVLDRIKRHARGHVVERSLAAVLLITGIAMATNLDIRFENALAKADVPAFLRDPTSALENSSVVQKRLASLRPASRFVAHQATAHVKPVSDTIGVSIPGVRTPALPVEGAAPEFVGTQGWFNTPGDRPLTMAGLRGHVVITDFWTYTCINCIRTLPFLEGLYRTYHRYGLQIVGIEAPEFAFEQEASNVRQAIQTFGIKYPVVQDNNLSTWNAYQNQYWPADYFIDASGNVRHTQFGEGKYKEDEAVVRQLLYDAGARQLPPPMTASAIIPSTNLGTPETYLNPKQYQDYGQIWSAPILPGVHTYSLVPARSLQLNEFSLGGSWHVGSEAVTPTGAAASIEGGIQAQHEYLVMTSAGNVPRTGEVLLDGRPIPNRYAGADVHNGHFTVVGQRLYSLVSFPRDEQAIVTVVIPRGVSAYDFTFG
jgi:cytochrome c biogenesis protein CcdA/thiol-disulfide isomerase/thioredoxin